MQNMDLFSYLLLSVFCNETLKFMENKLLPKTPNIDIIETYSFNKTSLVWIV